MSKSQITTKFLKSIDNEISNDIKKMDKYRKIKGFFDRINKRQEEIKQKYPEVKCGIKDEKCGKYPVCIVCMGTAFYELEDGYYTMDEILKRDYDDWTKEEKKILKVLKT